jgi:hypothetical protein
MRGRSTINFLAMCSIKPLQITYITMLLLTGLLTGCGGVPRAYFYEGPTGDRFYETTSEKVEQIMEGQAVWETRVPNILWVTTRGEVVDITAAVGTTKFVQAKEFFPIRENSEEQSRLLWGFRDTGRDNLLVELKDITSFVVRKVPWNEVKQDWDLNGFDIVTETGRCRPITMDLKAPTLLSNPFGESPYKDPSMKRRNCLNLVWEMPLSMIIITPILYSVLVLGPFVY